MCMEPDFSYSNDSKEQLRRRMFLLNGWGRFALNGVPQLKRECEEIVKLRPRGNWGILVNDDNWARAYQIRQYRIQRVSFAFGVYGIMGEHVFRPEGFVKTPAKELARRNNESFHRNYRSKAHAARAVFKGSVDPYVAHCENIAKEVYYSELASMVTNY